MSSSFNTISEILEEWDSQWTVDKTLKNFDSYWAHTPSETGMKAESLGEHLHLVQIYFKRLVERHHLDHSINHLIKAYLEEKEVGEDSVLSNYLKVLFVQTICYHDHGKINENFQASHQKMNNPNFKGKENPENKIDTQHSTLSSFIFLNHKFSEILAELKEPREIYCAFTVALLLSYNIYRHHSYHLKNDFWLKIIKENQRVKDLKEYLNLFQKVARNEKAFNFLAQLDKLKNNKHIFEEFDHSSALYQFIRLNFSLLTASDYLATNEYSNGFEVKDFGILNTEAKDDLYKKVSSEPWIDKDQERVNFNKKTYDEMDALNLNTKPTEISGSNLNLLRQQMATEAVRNVRKNLDKKIFYLEAPTGGGKTNISLLLTLELLKNNPELNKVYYVFPFTTLIDQTFKSIKEMLGLPGKDIVALHSRASHNTDSNDDEVDANYGAEKKNYINRLFVNFPFTLLSHVRFFDILKTNIKEVNYLLHRLANSVVVIDELQSYNPDQWDKLMFLIKKYADWYNIRFIMMSATLPKIGNLEIKNLTTDDLVYLLPNSRKDYFNNPNFSNRVTFDFSLSKDRISINDLALKVLEESTTYSQNDQGAVKPKGSVYTVVEFIFKNAATRFEKEIQKINAGFFDKIFVLSGTILSFKRREIINYLKNKSNRHQRILLITTQVVEAGVDIDMDLGFKDSSLIDSDEQLAGRINRNVTKKRCTLFLFNYSREAMIYGKDLRYEMTKNLSGESKKEILQSKNFDLLYQKVIDFRNKQNKDPNIMGIEDYRQKMKNLQFESVANDFKLIDQENFSCFIPLYVPVTVPGIKEGEIENIFNSKDLAFLAENNIFPNENNEISGSEIYVLYEKLISGTKPFMIKKIELKQVQSLLSNYVFSLFASEKNKQRLTEFIDVERSDYGYFYMQGWKHFYSVDNGIDETAFDNVENQFI